MHGPNMIQSGRDTNKIHFKKKTNKKPVQPLKVWLHMMTSANGNNFRVTSHLCGEFTGPRWIPAQRPVARSFDVFVMIQQCFMGTHLQRNWFGLVPIRQEEFLENMII